MKVIELEHGQTFKLPQRPELKPPLVRCYDDDTRMTHALSLANWRVYRIKPDDDVEMLERYGLNVQIVTVVRGGVLPSVFCNHQHARVTHSDVDDLLADGMVYQAIEQRVNEDTAGLHEVGP